MMGNLIDTMMLWAGIGVLWAGFALAVVIAAQAHRRPKVDIAARVRRFRDWDA